MTPIHAFFTPFYAFLLGVSIGSFLNVCILRHKSGDSIVVPASSRCPRCRHPLSWFENIPLLSFLCLQGRCRHCGRPISLQYPLVEALTGFLFWSTAMLYEDPFQITAGYFWSSFLVLLVVSDIKWHILPHPFNNIFVTAGFTYSAAVGLRAGSDVPVLSSVEGFLGAGALMLFLTHWYPQGLGGGDVKMIAAFGAWFGLTKSLLVVFLAFGAGAILTLPLLLAGRVHRKTLLPFGPFLAASAMFVWVRPEQAQYLLDRMT